MPDGVFHADPAGWAFNNEITIGSPAGSSTFKPLDGVTRGESVTFLRRYDSNVVQPALDDTYTKAEVDAAVAAEIVNAGTATRPTFEPDGTLLSESFTTTTSGRLHITSSLLFGFSCTPDPAIDRYIYLMVDDVPIEASVSPSEGETPANQAATALCRVRR